MSKLDDLTKIDRTIKDCDLRLKTIKANMEALEREIDSLSTKEIQISENLQFLKSKNVKGAIIALEFKDIKVELSRIKHMLSVRKNEMENYRKAFRDTEDLLTASALEYAALNNQNNVIQGKFGKKDG